MNQAVELLFPDLRVTDAVATGADLGLYLVGDT